jgi:aspartokinase-like uncharacterized kinase
MNAHLLAELLGTVVDSPPDQRNLEGDSQESEDITISLTVIDPHEFCRVDDGRPASLPHTWDVTSDSVAARVAEVAGAELVLLKSADLPVGMSWEAAAAHGLVDPMFGSIVGRAGLRVRWVNLRRRPT